MNNDDIALGRLVLGITSAIQYKLDKANFNKGVTGRVLYKIDDTKYKVKIDGQEYIAKSRFELQPEQVVKIIKWNNNFNELYVIY